MASELFLVYEFLSGGGLWSTGEELDPRGSLLREGAAMARSLAADLSRIDGAQVVVMRDSRCRHLEFDARHLCEVTSADAEITALLELGTRADGVFLIAPEIDRLLTMRCELIEQAGGRLLSPGGATVRLCSDKHATALWLADRGVPTPAGELLDDSDSPAVGADWRFPAVVKPIDGCGSLGVRRVDDAEALAAERSRQQGPWRVETWSPGLAASVAVLCGPDGHVALPAATQRLADDRSFVYQGGELPLPPALDARARDLAARAVARLPVPVGYLGVDLVLGDAADGSDDCVIEINPRLTTSYLGLRRLATVNLAAAMTAIARGTPHELSFLNERLEFDADGATRIL